jgi:hypothetical protein
LDTITQPVLGKFPIKVKIPMTISNSVPYFLTFLPLLSCSFLQYFQTFHVNYSFLHCPKSEG